MSTESPLIIRGVLFIILAFTFGIVANVSGDLDLGTNTAIDVCRVICDMEANSNCSCTFSDVEIRSYGHTINAVLHCKSDNVISLQLQGTLMDNDLHYLLEIKRRNSNWEYNSSGRIDESKIFVITNLGNYTEYKFRIWIIQAEKIVYAPIRTEWMRTSSSDVVPLPVKELKSSYYFGDDDSYAVVEWAPAEDLSCYYFVIVDSPTETYSEYIRKPSEIRNLFKYRIKDIVYSQTYVVSVKSRNSNRLESDEKRIQIVTHSCIETYNNLSICTPETPRDLCVEEVLGNISHYNLNVSWARPTHLPDLYEVLFQDFYDNITREVNVSGDSTNVVIERVNIGHVYHIAVKARSPAGLSDAASYVGDANFQHRIHKKPMVSATWIAVLSFLSISLSITLALLAYWKFRIKRKIHGRNKVFKDLEHKCSDTIRPKVYQYELQDYMKDEWEVNSIDIILHHVLGQGAFGVVRYGSLTKGKLKVEVAAKTLKSSPTREELGHFQHELEIMKSVGSHPHLVSLLGICLHKSYGPLLIVEYCSKGDLQNYLKNIWEKLMAIAADIETVDKNAKEFVNRLYEMEPIDNSDSLINPKELLSFARQIARGMEYLSKLKILHRDLAARNVLICEDMTVKVSDFGLSRDVYKDNVYHKKAGGKLPIRWMAIECLTHQQYTTQSDVWSFGIVLWEIVTLGGTPYPGIATEKLLKLLIGGYRMECPVKTRQEIYDIMMACWQTNPKDRPSFTDISKILEELLESETEYLQVDMNTRSEMDDTDTRQINTYKNIEKNILERYVRPIFR